MISRSLVGELAKVSREASRSSLKSLSVKELTKVITSVKDSTLESKALAIVVFALSASITRLSMFWISVCNITVLCCKVDLVVFNASTVS